MTDRREVAGVRCAAQKYPHPHPILECSLTGYPLSVCVCVCVWVWVGVLQPLLGVVVSVGKTYDDAFRRANDMHA